MLAMRESKGKEKLVGNLQKKMLRSILTVSTCWLKGIGMNQQEEDTSTYNFIIIILARTRDR